MHSADRRPPWSQVAIMFVCSIPVVAIVAGIATAIPFALEEKGWGWYLLALSPGWVLSELISPHVPHAGWLDFRALFIAFFGNFVYWFVWIFRFVLRADKRWRQRRSARIDA
jgi:hypothetical protein